MEEITLKEVTDICSALASKRGHRIAELYTVVMEEEERRDFEWSMSEDQTGISRYDALDFGGVCAEVLYRYKKEYGND